MQHIPNYEDLFGSVADALLFYQNLFPQDTTPTQEIQASLNIAYEKIAFIFGEFRAYKVGEDTVRNHHVKTAVCFEANSLINFGSPTKGGFNTNTAGQGAIKSEKMEDVSVTYADGGANASLGLGDDSLMNTLGLLSKDASIILSRYIRKTYGWGTPEREYLNIDANKFPI